MKKLALALSIFFLPLSSYAECDSKSCDSTIQNILLSDNEEGNVYFELTEETNEIINCTLQDNQYLTLQKSHPLFTEMFSLSMSSMMVDKRLEIGIVENSSGCSISSISLYR